MVSVSRIMEYEEGSLDLDEVVELFQAMIDDGSVWSLQGYYGRTAMALIKAGHCKGGDALR